MSKEADGLSLEQLAVGWKQTQHLLTKEHGRPYSPLETGAHIILESVHRELAGVITELGKKHATFREMRRSGQVYGSIPIEYQPKVWEQHGRALLASCALGIEQTIWWRANDWVGRRLRATPSVDDWYVEEGRFHHGCDLEVVTSSYDRAMKGLPFPLMEIPSGVLSVQEISEEEWQKLLETAIGDKTFSAFFTPHEERLPANMRGLIGVNKFRDAMRLELPEWHRFMSHIIQDQQYEKKAQIALT